MSRTSCTAHATIGLAMIAGWGIVGPATAAIVELSGPENQPLWESLTASWNTLDFTGFEQGLHLTDEYAEPFGVTFTDSTNYILYGDTFFPEDGRALATGTFGDYAEFTLAEPATSISFSYPGALGVRLYLGDELILDSGGTGGQPGIGNFYGVVSDVPFDRVQLHDQADIAFVDDIRIGMAVPGPGGLVVFLVAGAGAGAGRRRRAS